MLRFPLLGQKICQELDNENLTSLKNTSRGWVQFLNNNKFYWIRKIGKRTQTPQDYLRCILKNTTCEEVKQVYMVVPQVHDGKKQTFMHWAAMKGCLTMAKNIMAMEGINNDLDDSGASPLHYAARNGHFAIFNLIISNVVEKNLANKRGLTPLHNAARNGHFEICKLIVDNVEDKNPKSRTGITPTDMAAWNDHDQIKDIILGGA